MTDSTDSECRAACGHTMADATRIDEPMIDRLVRRFYARIRKDAILGPIFEARIADWEPHLQRMCAFWSAVALRTGRYRGEPMRVHLPLPVDSRHFDRWLELFAEAAREVCPSAAAEFFIDRARRIAASLELGIAISRGEALAPGERYVMNEATPQAAAGSGQPEAP